MEFCNIFDCSQDYIVFGKKENPISSRLPEKIVKILHTGDEKDIELLNRYLEFFIELKNKQE